MDKVSFKVLKYISKFGESGLMLSLINKKFKIDFLTLKDIAYDLGNSNLIYLMRQNDDFFVKISYKGLREMENNKLLIREKRLRFIRDLFFLLFGFLLSQIKIYYS